MKKIVIQSILAIGVLSVLTGVIYPLTVAAVAKLVWWNKAQGSLAISGDRVIGSELLAQGFTRPSLFWPRPSATNYNPVPGGASNLGPTSQKLNKSIEERRAQYTDKEQIPYELLLASGSGLDPHLSPSATEYQIARVAKHSGVSEAKLRTLIAELTEKPTFGILGKERVNVLKLNLALIRLEQELRGKNSK